MRQITPFDQECYDAGQILEDVILVHGALEILFAAAPAGANPGSDHSPDHLEMAVTKVPKLFVDLDQGIEEGEREAEKRFVAVEHDEESGSE